MELETILLVIYVCSEKYLYVSGYLDSIFFLLTCCVDSISDVATTSSEAKCWITSSGSSSEYGHVSYSVVWS
jgi:hypothetical protein